MYNKLSHLGFSQFHLQYSIENNLDPSRLARVISTSHEHFLIKNTEKQVIAKISGKMRHAAESMTDFPVTGDWVATSQDSDEQINTVLPRKSFLARSAGGRRDEQILAANLDAVVIVMAAGRDFNLARLDRYLTLVSNQDILPILFVNKIDLIDETQVRDIESAIFRRHPHLLVLCGSVIDGRGLDALEKSLSVGHSFCVTGSSGVGKSSLINYFAGRQLERTTEIGNGTGRGRHTTTSGHLHQLQSGAILIDTPGLREVGITDAETGLSQTFSEIEDLAARCRFSDCSHMSEPGCAVQKAVEEGIILPEKLQSYQKLKRESAHFSQTVAEKRRKERGFGKMAREVLKVKKHLKG
ncbi:MAG: ribosome small subunit-dependent GTPase A [Candidatus Riflebacteria bacterium]